MKIEEIEQYFYDLAIRIGYSEYEANLIAREIMDVTKNRSDRKILDFGFWIKVKA